MRKVDETPRMRFWDWVIILSMGGVFGLLVALKYMGTL